MRKIESHGLAWPQLDRFDYLLASPEIDVKEMAYHYEQSRNAGSDHALVTATVEIP